jgi:hypothetical protein
MGENTKFGYLLLQHQEVSPPVLILLFIQADAPPV